VLWRYWLGDRNSIQLTKPGCNNRQSFEVVPRGLGLSFLLLSPPSTSGWWLRCHNLSPSPFVVYIQSIPCRMLVSMFIRYNSFVSPIHLSGCIPDLTSSNSVKTEWLPTSSTYLTLPYLTFGAGAQGTPALRPQFGPNAQPRQASSSKKSLRGFCKPQENCPVDTVKSVQLKRVIT